MQITQQNYHNMIQFFSTLSKKKPIQLYYILAGQSNALGNTLGDAPTINLQSPINGALIWDGSQYSTLDYPINNQGNLFASELSFAKDFINNTGYPLTIEKTAVVSTAVAEVVGELDWNVNSEELIVDLRASLTRLKNRAISDNANNPKFVLSWVQGERDARLGTGLQYESNFQAIVNDIQTIQPLDLIIVGLLNQGLDDGIYVDKAVVKSQQESFVNNNVNSEALDLNLYPLGGDNLHYAGAQQEQIGTAFYQIVKQKFNL